jgi:formylglycine-generating enzyme required for sulfatase activity
MADASGNNANHFLTGDPSDPYPIDSGKYTTVAGEFQNSDSAYGTFDQGGNVWEWNEVLYWENFSYRGVRGGAFDYYVGYMAGASRNNSLPAYEYADTGFRVSEVPEPATMTLLALGGLGMLMGRRAAGR